MKKNLTNKEIFQIGKEFILGRGYACRLQLKSEIKEYLIKKKYITENEKGLDYYFLNKSFYNDYKKEINSLSFTKIEVELLKKYCAINIVYFDGEIMHMFLNNPNFHFVWDGYSGYVYSNENSKIDIYIKNLCMCHDLEENKIVLGAFIVDLINCSKLSQIILEPYILAKDYERYEFHQYNYKNLILGKWLEIKELDIYTIILEGIRIINYIFNEKYGFKLFKNEYEVNELQFYIPLFFPTKVNRFNFMMELAKIFLDNINGQGLKKLIMKNYRKMSNNNEFTLEDLKKEEFREYKVFKIHFGQYKPFNKKCFYKLDEIRKLRTEPAHKIYTNDIDYSYCKEQDETLKNLYRIIYNIIKVEDSDYNLLKQYRKGEYTCFYGDKGYISENNGFNEKNYHYYNGYIRLINDKFKISNAEILIAGNDKDLIKNELVRYICKNYEVDVNVVNEIIDYLMSEKICIPNSRELKSFFGHAFIKDSYEGYKDYKIEGRKQFNYFCNKNYKYIYLFADSTELYSNMAKIIENISKNKENLFGCGFLMCGLSNDFSNDDSNIFNTEFTKNFLILNNVWD